MKHIGKIGLGILMFANLSGCEYLINQPKPTDSNPISPPREEVELSTDQGIELSKPSAREKTSSATVQHLIDKARRLISQGKTSSAESSLDRALRIDPTDPHVFLAFAQLYHDKGEYELRDEMVVEGLEYAIEGSSLYHQLQAIRRK